MNDIKVFTAGTIVLSAALSMFCGFVTHLWWSFSILMNNDPLITKQLIIMLLGIFIPPLGSFHGIYLWFN